MTPESRTLSADGANVALWVDPPVTPVRQSTEGSETTQKAAQRRRTRLRHKLDHHLVPPHEPKRPGWVVLRKRSRAGGLKVMRLDKGHQCRCFGGNARFAGKAGEPNDGATTGRNFYKFHLRVVGFGQSFE